MDTVRFSRSTAVVLGTLTLLTAFAVAPLGAEPPAAPPASDQSVTAVPTGGAAATQTSQADDDDSPKLDAAGNPITTPPPVPVLKCVPSKGHKCSKQAKKKEKPPKVTPASIARGTFTVDGVIGKAGLNYSIPDLKFIYFYAPGIGAVVVSNNKFPGSVEEKGAFHGQTLTIKVAGEHVMELYSDDILLSKHATVGSKDSKNKAPESAFILFNPDFTLPTRFPLVGYGNKPDAPYVWPGSRMNAIAKGIDVDAPPVPIALTPQLAANPCPAGQVLLNPPPAPRPPPAAGDSATVVPPPPPSATSHPKCVAPKDMPVPSAPGEQNVPLDKRARS